MDFTRDTSSETNTGQFVMALNVAAFGLSGNFEKNVSRVLDEMRASDPLPGHDSVRLPGDGKSNFAEQHRENGLVLNPALRRDLQSLAQEYGIDAMF